MPQPPHKPAGTYRSQNSEGWKPYFPFDGAEAPRGWPNSHFFISSLCLHATWPKCRHSHRSAWHFRLTKASASWPNNWKKGAPGNCKIREVTEREDLGKVNIQRGNSWPFRLTLKSHCAHRRLVRTCSQLPSKAKL